MLTRLCRAALLLPFLIGCYTYTPVAPAASPVAGEPVALDITDAGRVGLAERFGPGLTRVEGRLTSPANQEYALSVHKVAFIGQPSSRWSGELVRIDRQYVNSVWQRKLSPGRTALAVGLFTVGIAAVFIGADLVGFFDGATTPPPDPPGPISNRVGH